MATSIFREYFKGYEILGELGRGNARVLKAKSVQSGQLVAIKHFAFNTDPDTLRRFQRESEIMKSIQHDHVVKIIEVHLDAELPYIVMELIEGGDVRSLLKAHHTLDLPTVIRLAHHITEALDAIHTKAVVHRDIKPENIMFRRHENGELQFLLTDFGIAKLREQADTVTVTGASMLTYEYASPEQFNQSKNVSTPTDYYSLGVVIYECITGAVPFEYENDDLLMHINRVISAPVPVPRMPGYQTLPVAMLQLIDGLLTKQSLIRLSDPARVRHLLNKTASDFQRKSHTVQYRQVNHTLPYQAPPPAAPKTQSRRSEAGVITLILLLVSVVVFFSWTTFVRSRETASREIPPVTPPAKQTTATGAKHIQPLVSRRPQGEHIRQATSIMPTRYLEGEEVLAEEEVAEPLNNGIYYNDFSDQDNAGWDLGRDENSDFYLNNGKYIMKGLADSLSYSSSIKIDLDIHKDFTLAANITPKGDGENDAFGLNFCGDEKLDSYLVFYITPNGYYSIGAVINGEWNVMVDWTPTSHIRQHAEMNSLSIEQHNGMLRFLINDRLEKELSFNGGYGQYFGMRVDGAQTVAFDQFIVKGTQ